MIITTWVLWFTITLLHGEITHFPVEDAYRTQALCEADIPEWTALLAEQFPNDPNVRVYCEAHETHLPTKGI